MLDLDRDKIEKLRNFPHWEARRTAATCFTSHSLQSGLWHLTQLHILHKCDYPPCCNPLHLMLGTQADNMRDCYGKGRGFMKPGEKHIKAKLTEENVREIRHLFASKEKNVQELIQLFQVSEMQIRRIIHRQRWAHVI